MLKSLFLREPRSGGSGRIPVGQSGRLPDCPVGEIAGVVASCRQRSGYHAFGLRLVDEDSSVLGRLNVLCKNAGNELNCKKTFLILD